MTTVRLALFKASTVNITPGRVFFDFTTLRGFKINPPDFTAFQVRLLPLLSNQTQVPIRRDRFQRPTLV